MDCDLIVCAAIQKNYSCLGKSVNSVKNVKRKNNYILFDGAPENKPQERKDFYLEQQRQFKEYYPSFEVVSRTENMYFKPSLEKFVRERYDDLSDYLLILQDDVEMQGLIDVELVINKMEDTEDSRIVFFGEDRKRAPHWFELIDDKDALLDKLHGWCERVFMIRKDSMIDIFNYLRGAPGANGGYRAVRGGKNGKFIDVYYNNKMTSKRWKYLPDVKKLEYWELWGCYAWKNLYHKHLVAKR